MISNEKEIEIKNIYNDMLEELKRIEIQIEKNGILNNGLSDSTESFEQGYIDAIECICNILEIEL